MKAKFETDDTKEIARIVKSLDMALVLFEFNQYLLNQQRQHDNMIEHFHEWLRILGDYNIDLEELLE